MIQGWDELQRQLKAIAEADYVPALEKGVREAIFPQMQALTPVDKGDLLASEEVRREGDAVSLIAGTDHALPVEFGTIYMAAQSFMRVSIDTKSNEAMKIAAHEAEEIIKKVI